MTSQTTPSVWVAGREQRHVDSYVQRIAHFADSQELSIGEMERAPGRILHDVTSRATAWFLVTAPDRWTPELLELAAQCRAANPGFRCLVLVDLAQITDAERAQWPAETLYISRESLSTSVIDRLRSETHAHRIASHRRRQIERLHRRTA